MLFTNMMTSSANAPLEQGECVFDSVCMNIPHHIDLFRVIDSLMFFGRHASSLDCGWIGRVIIGKDHFRIFADIFADIFGKCLSLYIFRVKQSKLSVALPDAD